MVLIDRALCLPAVDIAALLSGQSIAAIPNVFVQTGWTFALYPYADTARSYPLNPPPTSSTIIQAWAKCEQCLIIEETNQIELLSHLTIWSKDSLKDALEHKQHLFLTFLRVYHFPEPLEIVPELTPEKVGKFVGFSSSTISNAFPVLSDRTFAQRKQKLENLEPPDHPELEALHDTIAQLTSTNPKAHLLKQHIAEFLGWAEPESQKNADLAWISTINELATRSKEPDDDKKSNYQAGTDFEIVTRQGLTYLGFKVEEDYKGGAGGLDLFCSEPYPLVGECKSGKSMTDRAVEELDRIGRRHLRDDYTKATRLIIGPGLPTKNLKESALISKTSILGAMTFQKLVELQAKYPGSVNLIELRNYLKPGQSDDAIEQYINSVLQSIVVRSHLVQIVKDCLEKLKTESAEISAIHTAYAWSNPPCSFEVEDLYAVLLELSSPLTGYLGRIKGSNWKSDRFYFLRPLTPKS